MISINPFKNRDIISTAIPSGNNRIGRLIRLTVEVEPKATIINNVMGMNIVVNNKLSAIILKLFFQNFSEKSLCFLIWCIAKNNAKVIKEINEINSI